MFLKGKSVLSSVLLSVFFVSVSVPWTASAKVTDYLKVGDEQTISRGDFIRAAVRSLNISEGSGKRELPFVRVPELLVPYVEAAHMRRALDIFSNDLQLSRNITRGQAIFIVMRLKSLAGDRKVSFTDVAPGSFEEEAVSAALRKGWVKSESKRFFGVRKLLKGKEARELLQRAAGEPVASSPVPPSKTTQTKRDVPTIKVTVKGTSITSSGNDLPKQEILETIWNYMNDYYIYEEKIDPDEAAYKAAEAMVQSLGDPYSAFLRPSGINNLETQIRGTVTGIGAQVEQRNGILTIVSPLRGSPAEKSGLKPNDEILKADGIDLTGLPFLDAVNRVRGPKGSIVELTIRRNGVEMKVKVVRDEVKVPEIEVSWQGTIAVVRIMQFGKTTENELRGEMNKIQSKKPSGIVLDLRSNPGGLLNAANLVVSNFVPKGTKVAEIISRDGNRMDETSDAPTISATVPLVVLVNEGSASASEIVAGALQDLGRAAIVGTKTFGKGTVQQVIRFNDDSGLKITIAEWHTPKGHKIDGIGVKPDIVVEYASERDEQMLKALEILK